MKIKYKYVCFSPSELLLSDGDIAEHISTFELERFLEFEQELENIIVVSNEEDAVYAAPLCYKFGVKLQINNIAYPFIKTNKKQTSIQVSRELIRTSREKLLLDHYKLYLYSSSRN